MVVMVIICVVIVGLISSTIAVANTSKYMKERK